MEEISKEGMPEGDLEVQVSVAGEIYGSDIDGNPVRQTITEEALKKIADDLNAEGKKVLVDQDHASSRRGLDRNTRAVGWLSNFWTTAKGLFAKMFLTPFGKELVEGREYRYLSPTFTVDENGVPVSLEAAGAVNTPAMESIRPLINSKPAEEEKISMEMSRDELKELIRETFESLMEPHGESDGEETAETEEKTEKTEDTAVDSCGAEKPVQNGEPEGEPEKEPEGEPEKEPEKEPENEPENEPEKEPEGEPEKEPEEVIKIEALNRKPVVSDIQPEWKNLHGKDFWDWMAKHPDAK